MQEEPPCHDLPECPTATPDLGAKIAFFFTKRRFKQMTGLETATMLEPLRMYAYIPELLNAYGRLELAESKMDILSPRASRARRAEVGDDGALRILHRSRFGDRARVGASPTKSYWLCPTIATPPASPTSTS